MFSGQRDILGSLKDKLPFDKFENSIRARDIKRVPERKVISGEQFKKEHGKLQDLLPTWDNNLLQISIPGTEVSVQDAET